MSSPNNDLIQFDGKPYQVVNVPEDGDCGIHAIVQCLRADNSNTAREILEDLGIKAGDDDYVLAFRKKLVELITKNIESKVAEIEAQITAIQATTDTAAEKQERIKRKNEEKAGLVVKYLTSNGVTAGIDYENMAAYYADLSKKGAIWLRDQELAVLSWKYGIKFNIKKDNNYFEIKELPVNTAPAVTINLLNEVKNGQGWHYKACIRKVQNTPAMHGAMTEPSGTRALTKPYTFAEHSSRMLQEYKDTQYISQQPKNWRYKTLPVIEYIHKDSKAVLLTEAKGRGDVVYDAKVAAGGGREAIALMLRNANVAAAEMPHGGTFTIRGLNNANVKEFLAAFNQIFTNDGAKNVVIKFAPTCEAALAAHFAAEPDKAKQFLSDCNDVRNASRSPRPSLTAP